jgi:hypothetical protein
MCPHTSKKKSKPFAKSSRTKQFCNRSYTIFERLLNERHGECAKMEINASWFKITYVFWMEIINKTGRLTFAKRWKRQRVDIVLSNGIIRMFEINPCTVRTYFPTCASACVWHGHVDGSGEGFQVIFKDLLEVRT